MLGGYHTEALVSNGPRSTVGAMLWSVALALAWFRCSSSCCKHYLCLYSFPCLFIDWKVASEETEIGTSCQAIGSLKSLSKN